MEDILKEERISGEPIFEEPIPDEMPDQVEENREFEPEEDPVTGEEVPCEEAAPAVPEPDRSQNIRRKQLFRGALRFYALLLGGILCVLILLWCLMNPLKTLLNQYEISRPQYVAEEIFDTLFQDPDWALLYDMAGIQPTEFEGRKEYVAYMEVKVGDAPLRYVEIPGGVTGEKRYSVRLKNEELATFTMLPVDDGVSTFSRWAFGEVTVFFTRQESVTVNLMPGYTVYINGVPLDDRYTTLRVSTLAEEYLPEGLHGYRYMQQQINGLLVQPEVIVLDEYNNPVGLTRDPATGIYTTPIANTPAMTWGEEELIRDTVENHALFAIRAIPAAQLREFFAPGSQAYKTISSSEALASGWDIQALNASATMIKSFYRYSDDLFSVWAQATVTVTDKDGNTSSCVVGGTYFFSPGSLGNPIATEYYEQDLQLPVTESTANG